MCNIKNHRKKALILSRGLLHGKDFDNEFKCADCKEVILIIRKGVHFFPDTSQLDVEACIENPIGKRHSGCRLCNCTDWKPEHNA